MKRKNKIALRLAAVVGFMGMSTAIAYYKTHYQKGIVFENENLATAAWDGNEAEVRRLLKERADPESRFDGQTAMQLAERAGHPAIVALLKKAGARK